MSVLSTQQSPAKHYVHNPAALLPFIREGVLDTQAFLDAERRRYPRPASISPPYPWQSALRSIRPRSAIGFYTFEITAFLLLVAFVGVITWNAVSSQAPASAVLTTLGAMLATALGVGVVLLYRRVRFKVAAAQGAYDMEVTQQRMLHESRLLEGVVTSAQLTFDHGSDGRLYSDLPPDDSLIVDIAVSYTYTTPDGRQKTGWARRRLDKYFYGARNRPDPARIAEIETKYTALYGDITGAPVYILYLDDRNVRLL